MAGEERFRKILRPKNFAAGLGQRCRWFMPVEDNQDLDAGIAGDERKTVGWKVHDQRQVTSSSLPNGQYCLGQGDGAAGENPDHLLPRDTLEQQGVCKGVGPGIQLRIALRPLVVIRAGLSG